MRWDVGTIYIGISAAAKRGYRYQCGSVLSRLPFELNVERRTALVLPNKAGETLQAFCREARQRELGQMCLADRGVSLWGTLIDLHMPRSFLPDYLSGSDTLSDGVFHDWFFFLLIRCSSPDRIRRLLFLVLLDIVRVAQPEFFSWLE
jgi:hypothetical protein